MWLALRGGLGNGPIAPLILDSRSQGDIRRVLIGGVVPVPGQAFVAVGLLF